MRMACHQPPRTRGRSAVSGVYRRAGRRDSIDSMYETFDHTADLGLRIRAADLNTLFAEAAQALFATLVENIDAISAEQVLGEERLAASGGRVPVVLAVGGGGVD